MTITDALPESRAEWDFRAVLVWERLRGQDREYLIEKLAAVGWDRAFLERVTHKADALSKASIRPLEKERREVDDRLQSIQREIQGLLNLAKQGGPRETPPRRSADWKRRRERSRPTWLNWWRSWPSESAWSTTLTSCRAHCSASRDSLECT